MSDDMVAQAIILASSNHEYLKVFCLVAKAIVNPRLPIALRLVAERLVTLPSAPQVFPHDDDWRADY